jgi:hypothetical protein
MGNRKQRHCGVIKIQDDVADMLISHYKLWLNY